AGPARGGPPPRGSFCAGRLPPAPPRPRPPPPVPPREFPVGGAAARAATAARRDVAVIRLDQDQPAVVGIAAEAAVGVDRERDVRQGAAGIDVPVVAGAVDDLDVAVGQEADPAPALRPAPEADVPLHLPFACAPP